MSTYQVLNLILPTCGELDVNGHCIPILDLKELQDKQREEPAEDLHAVSS